jgi:Uma2 family endonuclease
MPCAFDAATEAQPSTAAMGVLRLPQPDLSDIEQPERWVAWMETLPFKFELIGDRLVMMTGGTRKHALLSARVVTSLTVQLRGQRCEAYNADFLLNLGKIDTDREEKFYPVASVVCDETRDWTDRPVLLVEVLSKRTWREDWGRKLTRYRQIPSLIHLVYLWQDEPRARVWEQGCPEPWEVGGMEATVDLPRLGLRLLLSELYQGIVP